MGLLEVPVIARLSKRPGLAAGLALLTGVAEVCIQPGCHPGRIVQIHQECGVTEFGRDLFLGRRPA